MLSKMLEAAILALADASGTNVNIDDTLTQEKIDADKALAE